MIRLTLFPHALAWSIPVLCLRKKAKECLTCEHADLFTFRSLYPGTYRPNQSNNSWDADEKAKLRSCLDNAVYGYREIAKEIGSRDKHKVRIALTSAVWAQKILEAMKLRYDAVQNKVVRDE